MQSKNIKIAITGGIGSGKTAVSDIIAGRGYKVLSCDKIYFELLSQGAFNAALKQEFGNVFLSDGSLDRAQLSARVFNNEAELKKLNKITHPIIMQTVMGRLNGVGLNFCEVPLLFENGFESLFDAVIVVLRDIKERIAAVVKRDGLSEKDVENRINQQYNYNNLDLTKYYVLHDCCNLADLELKTLEILDNIEKKYFQKK
ncbi:MAG: dephospho-CoA kinase [Clostridia bacterium]|nr:dephospho-CoA kinase [Clostridia bacterium]